MTRISQRHMYTEFRPITRRHSEQQELHILTTVPSAIT